MDSEATNDLDKHNIAFKRKEEALWTAERKWLASTSAGLSVGSPLAVLLLRCPYPPGGDKILYYALMFLLVGLIAGALGMFGIAAIAGQIAWVLFLIGVALVIVHFITGRRVPR